MNVSKINNHNADKTFLLKLYGQDISRYRHLSLEEEVKLTSKIKKGDKKSLDTLIKANLRFVISVSLQYQNKGMLLEDLISSGNLGLIKAAKRYDSTKGLKFISYAVWWIRQSILKELAEQSRICSIPLNKRDKYVLQHYFGIGLDHYQTLNEIAYDLHMTRERVRQIKEKALKQLKRIITTGIGNCIKQNIPTGSKRNYHFSKQVSVLI